MSSSNYNLGRPDIVLMAITSQVHQPLGLGETLITAWQQAGLPKQGVIRPLFTFLLKTRIIKAMGQLQPSDSTTLESTIRSLLKSP